MIETWQQLQARLFYLGSLGEELAEMVAVAPPTAGWLYRVIADEAAQVAEVAAEYIAETDRARYDTGTGAEWDHDGLVGGDAD